MTWEEVDKINLDKLKSINRPVARIWDVYTGGSEALKADSETVKGLEYELLLARNARVMLTVNLWVSTNLVNSAMEIIIDILYKEKPEHISLPTVILVFFDKYNGLTLIKLEGVSIVPIIPIWCMWKGKSRIYSRLQILLSLS